MSESMIATLLSQLAGTGVVGVILVLVLLAYSKKDKELTEERTARLADAQKARDMMIGFQDRNYNQTTDLGEVAKNLNRQVDEALRGRDTVIVERIQAVRKKP